MTLGETIKHYRLKKQLSQQDLAAAAGISHPRISEIETGRGNPTVRTLNLIAQQLGVTLSQLFAETKSTKSKKTSAVA